MQDYSSIKIKHAEYILERRAVCNDLYTDRAFSVELLSMQDYSSIKIKHAEYILERRACAKKSTLILQVFCRVLPHNALLFGMVPLE